MTTLKDIGIKVELVTEYSVLCETLERVGIVDKKNKKIYPSCYCFKVINDGVEEYRICHFKELFATHGKQSTFTKVDSLRLKTIIYFLKRWNLITTTYVIDEILKEKIDVVKYSDKKDYKIIHKFKYNPSNSNIINPLTDTETSV
jgi:hypothetical protein